MKEKIIKILYDKLEEFHREIKINEFTIDDDLSKVFPFSSFEWIVVICEIETQLEIVIGNSFLNKRTLRSLMQE